MSLDGPTITPEMTSRFSVSTPSTASTEKNSGAVVQLTGTVEEGVESGCIVLVDDDKTAIANLLGLPISAYPLGSAVTVTGTYVEGLMTTCQQGKPFRVSEVQTR